MISTGFSALDNCIGGLKKGKLYTLAGFNFTPPWIVEHFAINMIANSRSYGVVHANYLPQSDGNIPFEKEKSFFAIFLKKNSRADSKCPCTCAILCFCNKRFFTLLLYIIGCIHR